MRILTVTVLAGLLLIACSRHPGAPAKLLPDSTYVHVMVELQLLKTYNRQQRPDSTTIDSLRRAIFSKYGTSPTQFEQSNHYYRQNVDNQSKRIKQAIEELRKDRVVKGDSTNGKDTLKTSDQ